MLPVARAEPPQCSGGACATWTDSIGSVEAPDRDPVGRSEQSEGIAVRDVIDRGIKCRPHLGVDLGQNQQESARKKYEKMQLLGRGMFHHATIVRKNSIAPPLRYLRKNKPAPEWIRRRPSARLSFFCFRRAEIGDTVEADRPFQQP